MKQQNTIQHQVTQKTATSPRQNRLRRVKLRAEIDRFRQQIEKRDADDGTGAESQHQVQLVAQS